MLPDPRRVEATITPNRTGQDPLHRRLDLANDVIGRIRRSVIMQRSRLNISKDAQRGIVLSFAFKFNDDFVSLCHEKFVYPRQFSA